MTELAPWLDQQITAAETRTRELLYWAQQTILTLQDPKLLGKHIPGWHDWPKAEQMCRERLAELDAMRAVLTEHAPERVGILPVCAVCADPPAYDATWRDYPCHTVRSLAAAFSTEPGYQPEWIPHD
ncbi:DUF6221 family protein [Micromonospora carbonacea]|uniref:Uncharacterized protein n=1 Tax=Micromonospora carbonacea TaxID=47853 RepID=A0A1C5AC69_9ACTN|nr:DUF6221 family protein [Micromonospora carbonacea]SCF42838.1 hypothetical protein GA0070563_112139 [Micromonospora carbonacea]